MHELGILRQIVRTVDRVTRENHIHQVKFITLQVGETSGVVPAYMRKLYPVATDAYPILHRSELKMEMVPGRGLVIKEIGY